VYTVAAIIEQLLRIAEVILVVRALLPDFLFGLF
jgi:hypothetical protein